MSMWDDEAGYDRDDPKHPGYAEAAFDRADRDRKLAREGGGGAARGRDTTPWPADLRHTEMCAWRYGGKCDCGLD